MKYEGIEYKVGQRVKGGSWYTKIGEGTITGFVESFNGDPQILIEWDVENIYKNSTWHPDNIEVIQKRMTNDEIIDIVKSFENGKQIQFRDRLVFNDDETWSDIEKPMWDFVKYEYRIKPQKVECWLNIHIGGTTYYYDNELEASRNARKSEKNGFLKRSVHLTE